MTIRQILNSLATLAKKNKNLSIIVSRPDLTDDYNCYYSEPMPYKKALKLPSFFLDYDAFIVFYEKDFKRVEIRTIERKEWSPFIVRGAMYKKDFMEMTAAAVAA